MNAKHWTAVDQTLADSFPASDPPAWNHGSQKARDERKAKAAAKKKPAASKDKPKRIRIGPSDVP